MNSSNNSQRATAIGAHILPNTSHLTYEIQLKFNKDTPSSTNRQLKYLIEDKIKKKEFFYGIEILARNHGSSEILDYNSFGGLMPLFTSIVWLSSEYWLEKNLADVEAIKLARKLQPHVVVLPHFSCYHLNSSRLQEFLNLNFTNVLAVRGDFYNENQAYKYSADLVANIRKLRGDSITIGVGGYPEGHPECSTKADDLDNLAKKVKAGADFIITQICFSSQAVIDFVQGCRRKEINVPILIGMFVPDNLQTLETVLRITKIKIPQELLEEYRRQSLLGGKHFKEYAVIKAADMIRTILSSGIEAYGVQFFTLNKFNNISTVLHELHKTKDLIKKR